MNDQKDEEQQLKDPHTCFIARLELHEPNDSSKPQQPNEFQKPDRLDGLWIWRFVWEEDVDIVEGKYGYSINEKPSEFDVVPCYEVPFEHFQACFAVHISDSETYNHINNK